LFVDAIIGLLHRFDHRVMMVIEIHKGGIDLFRPKIGVLPEDLFGGPPVVVMFARQVSDLIASPLKTRDAMRVNGDVRISNYGAHNPFLIRAGSRILAPGASVLHEISTDVSGTGPTVAGGVGIAFIIVNGIWF
jgi:hypothetical protein